jgi:simple sugar transport system permease protein
MMEGLLNTAAPLILASLGALLSDLSGALGIFIEGFMILGAFFSWVFASALGSFWGVLLSSLMAALGGWALARFVRYSGANPFIAGLALNLAAAGLTESLSAAWFGSKGVLRNPGVLRPGPAGVFSGGSVLAGQSPFVYLALVFTVLTAFAISRTSIGLRLRASGLSPAAAAERGVHPGRYREGAWAGAAFLAALAGAAVSFRVGAYTPGGIAGRGWIALAAVYLGALRGGASGSARVW